MEKDYTNFKSKTTKTTPQIGPIWCTHRIPLQQRKCHSRCTFQDGTPKTRATRLQHQSKQHRQNSSPPDHTDCTRKSIETTRNMWGHIKESNTKTTGKYSAWRVAQNDQRLPLESYWYFRDEITCKDGILYKGVRLIMPQSEWGSTLKVLHLGHYAIDKMNLRTRETVYWPGISEDMKVTYHRCDICAKFARTHQKETLQYVETPQAGREQLGLDLFSLRNMHYLLAFDYFSWFPIVRKLQSLHSVSVIKHLKEIFMEIGVLRCIVSDGGTQFTSQEFKDFMRRWDIQHRITSLTNVQSNGQAEHFVQTIKNSLTKAMEGGEDPYLAIPSYITTPLNHSLPSPTELLNSRKFRCLLPLQAQQQEHTHQYRRMMQHQKHEQPKHYNKSAKDLPSLKTEDAVHIQLVPNGRRWIPATVVEILGARSYKLKTSREESMSETENLSESGTQTWGRESQDYTNGHSTRWGHYIHWQAQEDH